MLGWDNTHYPNIVIKEVITTKYYHHILKVSQ